MDVKRNNRTKTMAISEHVAIVHMAYFFVNSAALASNFALSLMYSLAMSGTRGSSGLGSVRRDDMERRTLDIVNAGLHWSFKISRQIPPDVLTLGW